MRQTVAVVLMALATGCNDGAAPPSTASNAGGARIAMHLPSSDGALVALPVAGAKSTVLDFFAPTCAPCAKRVPEMVASKSELAAKGARLVLVAVLANGETTESARAALAKWGVGNEPFVVDSGDVSLSEAGVKDLPTTLVLDASGRTIFRSEARTTATDVLHALP